LSPGTESSIEILQRLLEADFGRIEFAHGRRQPVLGEVVRLDLARRRNQLHRAHRRLVVAIGQHVDVGMGDALAVQPACRFGQAAIGKRPRFHQDSKCFTERLGAGASHRGSYVRLGRVPPSRVGLLLFTLTALWPAW